MLAIQKQNIPALLSYLRFHIIEPDSPRAKENFKFIQELMFFNVEKLETIQFQLAFLRKAWKKWGMRIKRKIVLGVLS